jgi:hypothetical protein
MPLGPKNGLPGGKFVAFVCHAPPPGRFLVLFVVKRRHPEVSPYFWGLGAFLASQQIGRLCWAAS